MQVIERGLRVFEEVVIGVGLFVTTVIIFANVVARYVFQGSFVWAEEIARYLIIWVTFVGMSACVRLGAHVTMDVFFNRMPEGLRRPVWRVTNAVAVVFSLYLGYTGWLMTKGVLASGQVSPATGVPMWLVYLAVPVGAVLTAKNFLLQVWSEPPASQM